MESYCSRFCQITLGIAFAFALLIAPPGVPWVPYPVVLTYLIRVQGLITRVFTVGLMVMSFFALQPSGLSLQFQQSSLDSPFSPRVPVGHPVVLPT
jgi:hypothetical protein